MPVFQLNEKLWFPPTWAAEADGLLAVGGDLSPPRLIFAYSKGIFPWYGCGDPILWWSPQPRTIIDPVSFHLPRRLARTLKQGRFTFSVDKNFCDVIAACATAPGRAEKNGWILPEMVQAYVRLHHLGLARSVECWQDGQLVGGLYGVALGAVFFGESMFSLVADASKAALAFLCGRLTQSGCRTLDCQVFSSHLRQFGAFEISGKKFSARLEAGLRQRQPLPLL